MQEKRTDIKKAILRRVRVLYMLFFMAGIAIVGKILYIQYGPSGDDLRKQARTITYERVAIEADRGDILARDGRILATSVPTYEIRMDFAAQGLPDSVFNRQVDSLAYCLAGFFRDKSAAAYKNMLVNAHSNKSKNRYVLISPFRVNHLDIKEISSFPIFRRGTNRGGFIPVQINQRLRPHGSMAARTIGMVNQSGVKVGIEGAFDSVLRGVDGNVLKQRISGSFWIPVADDLNVDPVSGIDVVTTLDIDIQDVAENALRRMLELADADWGTAVLMEVATGEIRAMTNLTRSGPGRITEDFNYAIGRNTNPGSTFKLASLMALLDDAGASLDETYDMPGGTARIGPVTVTDSHAEVGPRTLRYIFEHSSNIGFAKAVNKYYKDDPKRFVERIYKMGLALPLDLQIPGAPDPIIRRPGDRWWDGMSLTMMAYGYALEITPLRTLVLYNALANNGRMMSPLLVKELRQYGQTLRTYRAEEMVSAVASPGVVKQVQAAMQSVVDEGTAGVLRNPYYKVAAKTGTAQIAQGRGGYTDRFGGRHYLATMVGYFPADNPKYTCIVAIKTYNGPGHRRAYYGAQISGPVFRAIADRVYAQHTDWQIPVSIRKEKLTEQPAVKMGRYDEIREVSRAMHIPYEGNSGDQWRTYLPRVDSTGRGTTALLTGTGVVPSVVGMGLKEALYLLESEGLAVTFSGRGHVIRQSVRGGSVVARGATVNLQLGTTPLESKEQ